MAASRPAPLLLRELGVVLLSSILAVGIGELYLRRFDPQNLMTPAYDDVNGMRVFMPHARIKNSNRYFSAVYTTNAMGFRGEDHAVAKAPGVFRVVVLGPSHTFGIGVADDQTYSEVLRQDLERTFPRRKFEVINMGWNGIQLNSLEPLYRETLRSYSPDLVAVHFDLSSISEAETFPKRSFWSRDPTSSALVVEARGWLRSLRRLPGYTYMCEHSNVWASIRLRAAAALDQVGVEQTAGAAPAGDAGAERLQRAWLKVFGSFADTVCADGRPGSLRLIVTLEAERRERFPLVASALEERARRNACLKTIFLPMGPEDIYQGEGHWNVAGHRFVGDTLAKAVAGALRTGSR